MGGAKNQPSRKAENQRRYRQRFKAGVGVAPVPFDQAIIEALLAIGVLDKDEIGDRDAVGRAIRRLVERQTRAA